MKVILLKNVINVGQKFDEKEVADGFAQNFLLPQGLARESTDAMAKELESERRAMEEQRVAQVAELEKAVSSVSGMEITMSAKTNDKGHLFAAINSSDVAKLVSEKLGKEVDSHFIEMSSVKEVGTHEFMFVVGEKKAKGSLVVEAEK